MHMYGFRKYLYKIIKNNYMELFSVLIIPRHTLTLQTKSWLIFPSLTLLIATNIIRGDNANAFISLFMVTSTIEVSIDFQTEKAQNSFFFLHLQYLLPCLSPTQLLILLLYILDFLTLFSLLFFLLSTS